MSHQSVRLLLEDVAKSLADNIHFDAGRESEINNLKEEKIRYIWLLPLIGIPSPLNNTSRTTTWDIALVFLQKDKFDASNKETNIILDEQDVLVDKFLVRLDDWSQTDNDNVGQISVDSIRKTAIYKEQAAVMSGWMLSFRLTVPDGFIYCTPDNIRIYAGTY